MALRGLTDSQIRGGIGLRALAFDRVRAAVELRRALFANQGGANSVNPVDLLAARMPVTIDPVTGGKFTGDDIRKKIIQRQYAEMYAKMLGLTDESYNVEDILRLLHGYIGDQNLQALRQAELMYRRRHRQSGRRISLSGLQFIDSLQYRADGGSVGSTTYNMNGAVDHSFFKPKGTDTVPAMLTPGEFVIKAPVAKQHRSLLDRINRGQEVRRYASGGTVNRYGMGTSNGGNFDLDFSGFANSANRISGAFDTFGNITNRFSEALGDVTNRLSSVMNQISTLHIPDTIQMEGNHNVNVVLNGADVLQRIIPQIQTMIVDEVGRQLPGQTTGDFDALPRRRGR